MHINTHLNSTKSSRRVGQDLRNLHENVANKVLRFGEGKGTSLRGIPRNLAPCLLGERTAKTWGKLARWMMMGTHWGDSVMERPKDDTTTAATHWHHWSQVMCITLPDACSRCRGARNQLIVKSRGRIAMSETNNQHRHNAACSVSVLPTGGTRRLHRRARRPG